MRSSRCLLNVFTQLDFDQVEAKGIWQGILKHRKEMSDSFKRQVNLLTAICDYFLTIKKSFNYPKVVELKVFEEANHFFQVRFAHRPIQPGLL